MLTWIAKAALWLDTWLQNTIGRPYNVLLSVGLVTEIVRGLSEFRFRLASPEAVTGSVLELLMAAALLLHQIGQLSHRLERRGEGRRRGRT